MFKLFSLPALLLASLAIGVVASTPLTARDDDDGCVICTQQIPQCNCSASETCIIIPQTCFECAHAVCIPPRKIPWKLAGDQPRQWPLVAKWISREAVKPFVTEDIYIRKKVAFNPPPSKGPASASDLVPLKICLEARITQASVEKLGFIDLAFVKAVLTIVVRSWLHCAAGVFPGSTLQALKS
ncbi:hypothetical protein K438DRAFT_1962220 [Mycena galopus ATCC 62051]|nr:hypothetical protein K438DRAFT_1962220 [Mycena galopus ATCC 62051]